MVKCGGLNYCVWVNRTGLGRGRAWLRLAVMQKKLAEYFQLLIERGDIIE